MASSSYPSDDMMQVRPPSSTDDGNEEPSDTSSPDSFLTRVTAALGKSETRIAMITGGVAGAVSANEPRQRAIQTILGAVVPLLAFAYLHEG